MIRSDRLERWCIAFALVLVGLVGCNVFNPQGTSSDSGTIEDDLMVGDEAMRDRDFAKAYEAYSRALAADSSRSLAWYGLAKAMAGRDSLPITELISRAKDLGGLQAGDSIPFMGESDSVKNRFYKPLVRLQGLLTRYQRRDSLGKLDGKWPSDRIGTDLLICANLGLLFKLADLNRDTIIDSRDNLLKGVFDSIASGGAMQPNDISADSFLVSSDGKADTTGAVNPQKVADFNNFLGGMDTDLETNKALIDKIAPVDTTKADDGSSKTDVNAELSKFLDNTGSSISFWKMNDSLDNDGDGCVDEEVWGDKLDNDGDGLTGEDSRVAYLIPEEQRIRGMPFARGLEDGILNDRQVVGRTDSLTWVPGTDDDSTGFWTYGPDGKLTKPWVGLTWVDPKTDSVYKRLRAADTAAKEEDVVYKARLLIRQQVLKLPPRLRVAAGVARIGGCWPRIAGGLK